MHRDGKGGCLDPPVNCVKRISASSDPSMKRWMLIKHPKVWEADMPNVSEVTQTLKAIIADDSNLNEIRTRGEISDVKRPSTNNVHFTLRDDESQIDCVVFPWASCHEWISNPNSDPQLDRSKWLVDGRVELYSKESGYRFVVTEIQPLGDATVQPVAVKTVLDALDAALQHNSRLQGIQVQGEIAEVVDLGNRGTILNVKNFPDGGTSDDLIEFALPWKVVTKLSFLPKIGDEVQAKGKFHIFPKKSVYQIVIYEPANISADGEANLLTVREQPLPQCRECGEPRRPQHELCGMCHHALLEHEGIVVGSVLRYLKSSGLEAFSATREYRIQMGSNNRRADVVLCREGHSTPTVIAECKRIGYTDSGEARSQLQSYLTATGAPFGILAADTDPYKWEFLKNRQGDNNSDEIERSQFEKEVGFRSPVPSSALPRLELIRGDITEARVDAIVNAANSQLSIGSGVDGAIRRVGGEAIEQALAEIRNVRKILPDGDAVITPGGSLPARHVIHTVGPIWKGGKRSEPELLADCYRNSLQVAVETGIQTIAFPSISTGNHEYPPEQAAPIALKAVKQFVEQNGAPKLVQFFLFDEATYSCYVNALAEIGLGVSCPIG